MNVPWFFGASPYRIIMMMQYKDNNKVVWRSSSFLNLKFDLLYMLLMMHAVEFYVLRECHGRTYPSSWLEFEHKTTTTQSDILATIYILSYYQYYFECMHLGFIPPTRRVIVVEKINRISFKNHMFRVFGADCVWLWQCCVFFLYKFQSTHIVVSVP